MGKRIILASNILWTISLFRLGLIKYLTNDSFEILCLSDKDDFSELSEKKIRC
jgi:hypothetical protein